MSKQLGFALVFIAIGVGLCAPGLVTYPSGYSGWAFADIPASELVFSKDSSGDGAEKALEQLLATQALLKRNNKQGKQDLTDESEAKSATTTTRDGFGGVVHLTLGLTRAQVNYLDFQWKSNYTLLVNTCEGNFDSTNLLALIFSLLPQGCEAAHQLQRASTVVVSLILVALLTSVLLAAPLLGLRLNNRYHSLYGPLAAWLCTLLALGTSLAGCIYYLVTVLRLVPREQLSHYWSPDYAWICLACSFFPFLIALVLIGLFLRDERKLLGLDPSSSSALPPLELEYMFHPAGSDRSDADDDALFKDAYN